MQLDGSRIRAMREFRGLTQGQLAYKADTTVTQISRLENDDRPGAQAVIVARVAAALKTTVDYLVGLTDDPAIKQSTNNIPPDVAATVLEIQRLWREVKDVDPEAAERLMSIAIVQAEAFKAAVNAAQRRLEQEEPRADPQSS